MDYGKKEAAAAAKRAAQDIRIALNIKIDRKRRPIGLILGTGWGDVLSIKYEREIAFQVIRGFETLGDLEGHKREVATGTVADRQVIALRGRVHLNEGLLDDEVQTRRMVRLQTEMLIKLGVRKFIVTSAVGSLRHGLDDNLRVGDVAVINGFVTLFVEKMPLAPGEFVNAEATLDRKLRRLALEVGPKAGLRLVECGHVMVHGPDFEGREYDKRILATTGARAVGMSLRPEATVAALYKRVKVLGLGYVTDDDVEEMSHEKHQARAKADAPKLGKLLTEIIRALP